MSERMDSRLESMTDSGVRAKARDPSRSDQGPRLLLVLCSPGCFLTGTFQVLYLMPMKDQMATYPVSTARMVICSLVVRPKIGRNASGKR